MENKIYVKSIEFPSLNYSGDRAFIEYDYNSNLVTKDEFYSLQQQINSMLQTITDLQTDLCKIKKSLPEESKLYLEISDDENNENLEN